MKREKSHALRAADCPDGPTEGTGNKILDSLLCVEPTLRRLAKPVLVRAGECLVQSGQRPRWLCFPTTAVVSEMQMTDEGVTLEVLMAGYEGIVGLAAALNPAGGATEARVCVSGEVLKVPADRLVSSLRNSECSAVLGRSLADQVTRISRSVICRHYHSAEARLRTWLLMLSDRCGDRMGVTHEQIAASLAANRPTVSSILSYLREEGTIDYSRGRIVINDRSELAQGACECY